MRRAGLTLLLLLALPLAANAAPPKKKAQPALPPKVAMMAEPTTNFPDALQLAIRQERWNDAVPDLQRMAEQGNAEAKGALGMAMLQSLGGLTPDVKKARLLLDEAADAGDLRARRNLAQMLFLGAFDRGVPNYSAAWPYVEKLAAQRDPLGMYMASKYFVDGLLGVRNPQIGMQLLYDAAVGGARNAQYDLGTLFRRGISDEAKPNNALAAFWFSEAAKRGHPMALYEFGMANLMGIGVPKDPEQGAKLLERASETGNSNALAALGLIYSRGIGVAKDEARGKAFLEKAMAQLNPEAFHLSARQAMESATTDEARADVLFTASQAEFLGSAGAAQLANDLRGKLPASLLDNVQKRLVAWREANGLRQAPRISTPVN